MEGIIIKEIIEENFPKLRDVGLQIERVIKGLRYVLVMSRAPEIGASES